MKYRLVVQEPGAERAYQVFTSTQAEAEALLAKRNPPVGSHVQIFEARETAVLARTVGE